MIDASACTLLLSGMWSDVDAWTTLVQETRTATDAPVWIQEDDRSGGDGLRSRLIDFGAQPHGNMPQEVENAIHALGLGYLWAWEPAHLYDGGFELWRPGDGQVRTGTIGRDGRMLVPLSEAQNPHKVAMAAALESDRHAFLAHAKLFHAGSAHDELRAATLRFW